MRGYSENAQPSTLSRDLRKAGVASPRLYPAHGVNDAGVCTCWKGASCSDTGKHPATANGFKGASSDPFEIAEMFAAHPGCNPCMATGKESGVVVLDWDEIGCGGSLRRLGQHGPLPDTRTHRSGSGNLHSLYAFPPHLEHLPSRTFPEFDCELKADDAGVLLPPSRTDHGEYAVVNDAPLAPLPMWIAEMALRPSLWVLEGEGERRPTESRFALPERIREGARALTLYHYGCSLRAHGHDEATILGKLRRVNRELCDQPPNATHEIGDAEVRKIARSASRHEQGNATTATPEALRALEGIWAAVEAASWNGVGGASEYDVMVALVRAGRLHGQAIPAGVRVSLDYRSLGLAAGMGKSTANGAAHRLRRKGWLRFDNLDRRADHSGAFVLLSPGPAHPVRTLGHSTTPLRLPSDGNATENVSVPPCAPRLRAGGSPGKRCGQVVDALERHGGKLPLEGLAAVLGMKRPGDLRRRHVGRLVAAGVADYDEETDEVGLRDRWLEALDRERTMNGEKRAENLARAEYDRQREARRQFLAEQKCKTDGQ